MTGFIYYFAALGAILSGSTLFPSLIAFGFGETDVGNRLLLYGFVGGFFSVLVLLTISGRDVGIERRAAALLVVASWLFFPLLVAVPLADITGIGFVQAFFQTMASFTTTGSNVFLNPDSVPRSIIFLLAQFQWMGGLATLITFVLILSPWGIGGLPKMGSVSETASIVASQHRLVQFCGRLLRAFGGLTILCFSMLVVAGVPVFDASILSFSVMSTGGILPHDASLDVGLGNAGMIICGVFLIIGGTSIFWHRQLVRFRLEDLVAHRESYFVLAAWLGFALVISIRLLQVSGRLPDSGTFTALSEGIMNSASLVTTSGIQSRPGVFTVLAPSLVIFIVLIGGGAFSTAGGLKMFRIGAMFSHANQELHRLIYPHSVRVRTFSGGRLELPFLKRIWGVFTIWLLLLGLSGFLLNISGLNFQASFTASVASISNAGPVYGSYWNTAAGSGWLDYSDMSSFQLLILTTLMFFGRLEIIVVIASIALAFKQFR